MTKWKTEKNGSKSFSVFLKYGGPVTLEAMVSSSTADKGSSKSMEYCSGEAKSRT